MISCYLPCPRCGNRIINRLQYYDICACQIPTMIAEEPASERESRWLHTAKRLYEKRRYDEGDAVVEAVLIDRPASKAAQELLRKYQGREMLHVS